MDVTAATEPLRGVDDAAERARWAVMQVVNASAAALEIKDAPLPLRTFVLNSLAQAREQGDHNFTCRKAVERAHDIGDHFLAD